MEKVRVIDFSEDVDNLPDSEGEYTHATLLRDPNNSFPSSFTICASFMVKAWTTEFASAYMFQLNDKDGDRWGYVNMLTCTYVEYEVYLGNVYFIATTDGPLFPLHWTHICLSLDSVTGVVRIVVDGKVLHQKVEQEVWAEDENRPSNLSILLGMDVNYPSEFTGQTTNLNVFSSSLSRERMERMTGGEECGAPGDYLSWEETEWILHSKARERMVDAREPCRKESRINVFTADFKYHSDCMEHCQKIGGGRSPPLRTLQELETFQTELHALTSDVSVLPWLWVAETDKKQEGEWRDYYTGEVIGEYAQPWYPGHDDRLGEEYNCIIWFTDAPAEHAWGEWHCYSYDKSCPCQYSRQPVLTLRGLCKATISLKLLDTRYTPKQLYTDPNNMIILGDSHTRITHNDQTSQWSMSDARSNTSAVSRATKLSYVLGKHEWTIESEPYQCNKGNTYTTKLKLTGCREGEFTCDDGQCIRMEERCDQVANCRDESDENSCELLVLKESYNKKVPPVTTVTKTNFTMVAVPVHISIVLMKIVAMEETQHSIDFQFGIILEWKDNRAVYHNLKEKTSLNALTEGEIVRLWLPLVIYDNTDQKETSMLGYWRTVVTVARKGDFDRSDVDEVDEIEIFEGKDNTLTMRQVYTHTFQCQYFLQYYPFDTQVK